MKKSIKKLIIVFENLEYGGMTTFIENLVNSKSFKYFDILLITNKTNKGILSLKKNIRNKRFTLRTYSSLNATDISFVTASFFYKIVKIFNFILRPILFLISILQFYLILKKKKNQI